MNKARFEAFSDGVFAFAITLLILGIALPAFTTPPSDRELAHALLRLWPNLLAYVLSFAVIGIMWQNHHALFRLVERVDRWTVFLNLMLLGVTVFIPFATSTLGAYPSMRSSTFLYGLTLTSSGSVYNLMLAHLVRSGAFHPNVGKATIRQTVVAYRVGVVTYAVAMLTSLVEPVLSFALYLLVAGYYLFPRGVDADLAGKAAQD
ncbi:MAG: TMEM175 family protein [Candidatus Acidiferrales bacterium]